MNSFKSSIVISLLAGAWLATGALAQSGAGIMATAGQNPVVPDYTLELHDPFSPIGYRPTTTERPADAVGVVSNALPPRIDIQAKAKSLLRVSGIVKRGDKYVANINGTIVHAGDEVGVTVDGQTVVFVVRAISLKRVQLEPRE
jgi:hypothetical protein